MNYTTVSGNRKYPRVRPHNYPNEAEPGYFLGKIRNGILAAISSMCTVTFFLYLATI